MGVASKDPAAVLDFAVDWTAWLAAGDEIAASTWTLPAGLVQQASNFTTTATRVWLSGGVAGRVYEVVNRITTDAGLQDERTYHIVVEQQ